MTRLSWIIAAIAAIIVIVMAVALAGILQPGRVRVPITPPAIAA